MNTTIVEPARQRLAWIAGGLAVGVLAATLVGPSLTARAQEPTAPPTVIVNGQEPTPMITVTGQGSVFVKPDVADVAVGVVVQNDEASVASQEAAVAIDAIIAALTDLGIPEADIQTTQLSLSPVYDWDNNPPKIEGWEATTMLRVTVRDVSQAGAVVDAAVKAGANRVDGITFRIDDSDAATAEARTAAVANARTAADQLAREAGVTITGVISISEVSSPTPTPVYMEAAAAGAAMDVAATKVAPGQVEVMVMVSISYAIAPAGPAA